MFDEKKYTEDSIRKQLILIENHATDGSMVDAGCECVEGKHLLALEGYSDEGARIMSEPKKKEFSGHLGNLARSLRKNIEEDTWNMQKALHEAGLNPSPREYHPYGLTECEKTHPHVLKKLASCIRQVEKREGCTSPYTDCPVNPVAVCRASISCP